MPRKMELSYIGSDDWDRPVYKDEEGQFWKDVDPRAHRHPDLCTCGKFYGEPDTPMRVIARYEGVEVNFVPERVTW